MHFRILSHTFLKAFFFFAWFSHSRCHQNPTLRSATLARDNILGVIRHADKQCEIIISHHNPSSPIRYLVKWYAADEISLFMGALPVSSGTRARCRIFRDALCQNVVQSRYVAKCGLGASAGQVSSNEQPLPVSFDRRLPSRAVIPLEGYSSASTSYGIPNDGVAGR